MDLSRLTLTSLTVVTCAVLTACGGGNGGALSSVADATMTAASIDAKVSDDASAASSPTTEDATMQALAVGSTGEITTLAAEDRSFTINGAALVRYGAGAKWISKVVVGSGTCSNSFFGNDPVYGTVKSCQLVTQMSVVLAAEGQAFSVAGTMAVRYGAGSSWVTKNVAATGTCGKAFFGKDPIVGAVKSCQLVDATALGAASASTVGAPAVENATFFVLGTRSVRYGAGAKWVTKSVSGRATCSNQFFGGDPVFGTVKGCEVLGADASTMPVPVVAESAVPPVATLAVASLMPAVDLTKLVTAATGYATARVQPVNLADPGQNPAGADIGAFREYCEYSHMSYDDPIVSPGAAGAHLHTFLGNTGINRNSTAASVAGSGNSTCAGGTANRTGYWVPTVIDTKDGTPQKPIGSLIYYKQGYSGVTSASIKPFPAGLRMVAGNAASRGEQVGLAGFNCSRPDGTGTSTRSMPTDCPAGSNLQTTILFPQCWDGVNLDSPDHKSHMAYADGGCPSSHPVPLTLIQFDINYTVGSAEGTKNWRLSSDNYDKSLPGGYSMHGDWFNGWDTAILNTWTTRCINASMDCHAFLIGDGRSLF